MKRIAFSSLAFVLAIGVGWFFLFGMSSGAERRTTAAKKVTPLLKPELETKNVKMGSPVFIRAFKEERELELWMQEKDSDKFVHLRTYPIVAASGNLGPKQAEGDYQVPEGFYYVPPRMMNPNSRFHLAFNIGYPNEFDRSHGRTGSFIMVHGSNISIGCLAMTDEKIEEIYTLCNAAHRGGQKFFRVHIFPFHMTAERMTEAAENEWLPFWVNLEKGYRWFEEKKTLPNVTVVEKEYRFGEVKK
ncbi:MAG: murein L,D-transpeptidase family protein [Akkermansiaceae bacterium]